MVENTNRYNFEERLACFAEKIIDLIKKLPQDAINSRMISVKAIG